MASPKYWGCRIHAYKPVVTARPPRSLLQYTGMAPARNRTTPKSISGPASPGIAFSATLRVSEK
jgi:hypothetical protein